MNQEAQEHPMTNTARVPDVGTSMPNLSLVGRAGEHSNLHAVRNSAAAIVYFLRASTCPACIGHARVLVQLAESGKLGGTQVILIAPGDADEARRLADRVSSPAVSKWASGTAHGSAGMGSFLFLQHSGTFLVGTDGNVLYRRTAVLPPLSLNRGELLEALAR
jgi:peroxiredoxin